MNINKTLVLVGILFSAVLIIENMVVPLQAYVFVWITKTFVLSMASIATGMLIGYGLHGMMLTKNENEESDDYDF